VKSVFVGACVALALVVPLSASAAALVNGGFEAGPALNQGTSARGNGPPTGWSAIPGLETPDIISDAYTQGGAGFEVLLNPHGGDRFLDMNGASAVGGLFQDVTGISTGSLVTLTYWSGKWVANSDGALTASLIGTTAFSQITTIPRFGTMDWTQYTLSGIATATTVRVQFTGATSSCCSLGAPGLDDVALSAVAPGGVPEPATWALMIGGCGMAGTALRRRRAPAASA